MLGGNHIVWVEGGLSQFQSIKELRELFRGQGVDVLSYHGGFPQVTVWSSPAKLTLTTVKSCKVTCNTEGKLKVSKHVGDGPCLR